MCEIIGRIVEEHAGSGRIEYWCTTHGVPAIGYSEHIPGGDTLCPIGKIDAKTEEALAKIEAAMSTHLHPR